ncbi:MAG: hypothetical protein BKP49_04260 [Treponema sp. CETP13]|nr:MAG: hypothetical protein BKP49_04260 [Treponema sp. CETP13]
MNLRTKIKINIIAVLLFTFCLGSVIPQSTAAYSEPLDGYTLITIDGGNRSGYREPNVVTDIGFGDRIYWAYTNEYSQLFYVHADVITLQNDKTEPVNSKGRYYDDEAYVPGVESPVLDQGHVIADSLGGVSASYNITPQDSYLNRHGAQAQMEQLIRKSGGCTDFTAIITYPNTTTQIPNHYSFSFTINGQEYFKDFDNSDENTQTSVQAQQIAKGNVTITTLDKINEFIILKNVSEFDVNLEGWIIVSVRGNQQYIFDSYILKPGQQVKIGDSARSTVDLYWLEGRGVWNNSSSDPAELYDDKLNLISVKNN